MAVIILAAALGGCGGDDVVIDCAPPPQYTTIYAVVVAADEPVETASGNLRADVVARDDSGEERPLLAYGTADVIEVGQRYRFEIAQFWPDDVGEVYINRDGPNPCGYELRPSVLLDSES